MKDKPCYLLSLCLALLLLAGGGGFIYAAPVSTEKEVVISSSATDPLQVLFEIGITELNKGNYKSAIDIFASLTEKTNSPRVQLELARALFLDRRYRQAEQAFQAVLLLPDIPWTVQENIRLYLEEIDSALGYLKFGFSLVSDDNPRNFTDSRQVVIAGQLLNVIQPEDNKKIHGVRYSLRGAKAITENGSLMGYFDATYSDFEGSNFDRWGTDLGLFLALRSLPKLKLRVGLEESFYNDEHHYEFPYFGLRFTPKPVYQFSLNSEFKIGRLRVPRASYLDATNLTLTTKISKSTFDGKLYTSGDLYLEKSTAGEAAYSYHGGSAGISLSFAFLQGWQLKPYLSVGRRFYEATDPLWGESRRDTREVFGIALKITDLKVFGLTPEVGISYEENSSNIEFYSYDKGNLVLNFK